MKVCVIGGGAAGMMASVFLAKGGLDVILLEKNDKLGKKIYITGKGRCNLTNDCEIQRVLESVVHGDKFVRSAIYGFCPQDTMDFFENAGLKLVVERGNRVFPFSQKSNDVIKTLEAQMRKYGVKVRLNSAVSSVAKTENGFEVRSDTGDVGCDVVLVATGGMSYPSTGSTGDGCAIAKSFGINVVEPRQALAPLILAQNVSSLQGISLKNVTLTAYDCNGKSVCSEFGEMLFTQRGVSGPIALTVSSYVNRMSKVTLSLDLKPALDEITLGKRILRDFEERKNQDIKNVTRALLPERLNSYVIKRAGIQESKKVNSVTKQEREKLVRTLKDLRFDVAGLAPFSEAIVTAGGVDVKCLKPTCESKDVQGLYFVGETCDIDALTGGFNLQLAFATGVCAARDVLKKAQNPA